jgi:hypothetical protein
MKRKSTILGLCGLAVLAAGFLLSNRNREHKTANQNPIVVTQDGGITIVPPQSHAPMTIVADVSKPTSGPPAAITAPTNR